jgi:H+/Cl- antiporter ClcA
MENSMKMDNNHGVDGIGSIFIGCILAIGNEIFGWMNSVSLIQIHTIHWTIQAIIVGVLGSTASYFTNKLWKSLEKKFSKKNKHKNEIEQKN